MRRIANVAMAAALMLSATAAHAQAANLPPKSGAAPADRVDEIAALRRAVELQAEQIRQLRAEVERMKLMAGWTEPPASASSNANLSARADTLPTSGPEAKGEQPQSVGGAQDDQKRLEALEGLVKRFRWGGDVRVRYENFFQDFGFQSRHRPRVRLRLGLKGNISQEFAGGLAIASGDLNDPVSTNQTLTGFFNRKTIGIDKGWLTFKPRGLKGLELTGGKFAYTWQRTPLTFDNDLNPEGFSEKYSFDVPNRILRGVTLTGMQLFFRESSGGPDSHAAGGQLSGKLQFGSRVAITPSVAFLNWHRPDPIAAAVADGDIDANAMTNATTADGRAFLSGFLYNNYIVDVAVKTNSARFPLRLLFDYNRNLRAVCNAVVCGQDSAFWGEVSLGQAREQGDLQFGYSFARIEQDAIISQFNESDLRAPTNVLQHRTFLQYQIKSNTAFSYTFWLGRTLNRDLANAVTAPDLPPGTRDPILKRMQFDLIYKF